MAYVLLVDDEPDGREALRRLLEHRGHVVVCADNGHLAIQRLLAHTPDVVLLDLLMPQMDGVQFLEVIRSYRRLQSLPIVMLTAFPESPLAKNVRAMGVHHILAKGKVTFPEIEQAIQSALTIPSRPNDAHSGDERMST
jgi:CheY-like chemotaxis protein